MTAQKDTILTGIRSNDEPTLGNYLGAVLPMVEMQRRLADDYQLNMFVPDLHSFTTPIDHRLLHANALRNLKYFIAAGFDISQKNTYVYRQSFIPAHSELAWILNCFTYVGEMSRMTEYKEKAERQDNVSVGLFSYPVLMAADILLYGAKWVPVGDDQTQHLEIARDIAMRMNNKFTGLFPEGLFVVPEATKRQLEFTKRESGVRIRSLVNPDKKMSKSVKDPRGTILLSDDPADAAKKVMGATTDNAGAINFDWVNQPGVSNLLQILALLSGRSQEDINKEWIGRQSYGELKGAVAVRVELFLKEFRERYEAVDTNVLQQKLEANERTMDVVARRTLLRAQQAVGLRPISSER